MFWGRRQAAAQPSALEAIEREARERAARAVAQVGGLDLNRLAGAAATMEKPLPDAVVGRLDRGTRFAGFSHLPIADFDWPDSIHKLESAVTIRNLNDVVERLHEDVRLHPEASYKMALTPGGVHVFNLGEQVSPAQFYGGGRADALGADPNYVRLVQEPREIQGVPLDDGVFWVRTGAKPARAQEEEFISMAVPGTIGGLPRPGARELLSRYHDQVIEQEMARNPASAQALHHGRALLQRQLDTINASLRQLYGL